MRRTIGILFIILVTLVVLGCTEESGGANRKAAVEQRNETYDRAKIAAPVPRNVNFPLRRALVEFTERQDLLDHPWYVYILADTGNIIGYYVAQTVPQNACNFLSSTEDVRDDDQGNLVLTAPSLDGIFYGGGGASSACDAWFFFDVTTNALVQIRGVKFFTADAPLALEAEPIVVVP